MDTQRDMTAKERKRLQNRVAQRAYRRNQKIRIQALEEAVAHVPQWRHMSTSSIDSVESILDSETTWSISSSSDVSPSTKDCGPEVLSFHTLDDEVHQVPLDTLNVINHRPALHRAVLNSNSAMCRMLLSNGADISKLDSGGSTALHLAVEMGDVDMVKLLIDSGTVSTVMNVLGRTALFSAVERRNETIIRMLLDAQINVNSTDDLGETALHLAVDMALESIVLLLLEHGADVNA